MARSLPPPPVDLIAPAPEGGGVGALHELLTNYRAKVWEWERELAAYEVDCMARERPDLPLGWLWCLQSHQEALRRARWWWRVSVLSPGGRPVCGPAALRLMERVSAVSSASS